ncbi:hypothetical protein [Spirosoma montaniterrae]|nr:hypothetical protein [Spirosoma montaniterrae]
MRFVDRKTDHKQPDDPSGKQPVSRDPEMEARPAPTPNANGG